MNHTFILQPSLWKGEGKISLNMVDEVLTFVTQWNIKDKDVAGKVISSQEIQISGISEYMQNALTFFDFTSKSFSVEMENPNIGKIIGTGLYDDKVLAWQFRDNDMNFEGFETYHLQEDGSYQMHAEYVTSDQFRTQIDGRIWQVQKIEDHKLDEKEEDENA